MISFDLLGSDLTIFRNDVFAAQIKEKAKDRPVVFLDSYQDPSRYSWYNSGSLSHTFNQAHKRKNQFNIWMQDTLMNGQEVYVYAPEKYKIPEFITYRSFDKLKVKVDRDSVVVIENPYHYSFTFSEDAYQVYLVLFQDKRVVKYVPFNLEQEITVPKNSLTELHSLPEMPNDGDYDAYGCAVSIAPWPRAAVYYRYKLVE
ncbi:hypothetical protein GCM10007940_32900 [Portibacter lacus]|uniref:Uncharacterized protein n=2 Tax=Portibacter lacus TaxID=1099794 RepID=A0AA37WGX4_9BACT|nr:hypothetical protein GCM10007940_32900 [Portibacter lacus]